jgi:phosphate transport system protein
VASEPQALRLQYRDQIDAIDAKIVRLFALIAEAISMATEALLNGDIALAEEITERDRVIDELDLEICREVQRLIGLQAPVASDLRYLLSVLSIAPELERSGDLAEHVAQRAARGITQQLTPGVRAILDDLGESAASLWREASAAYRERDPNAAAHLEQLDDRIDELHDDLFTELLKGELDLPTALQVSLLGRFYERLGDHAVHISERVRYIAGE